ncbi:hypothetical protein [Paractinoplanes bogorensis]|uniref:hypothetical protein n=1 Tax=Paractinoplanes bogorensis TaxID=1610840 RepID=UPI001C051FB9|nr:hypothetical protein [Actinoplanes bogorensis]
MFLVVSFVAGDEYGEGFDGVGVLGGGHGDRLDAATVMWVIAARPRIGVVRRSSCSASRLPCGLLPMDPHKVLDRCRQIAGAHLARLLSSCRLWGGLSAKLNARTIDAQSKIL